MKRFVLYSLIVLLIGFALFFNGSGFNRSTSIRHLPQRLTAFYYLARHFFIAKKEPSLPAVVRNTAQKYGISAALIFSIIDVESSSRQFAISPNGAMGYMQLMPQTVHHLKVNDPFSRRENIEAGIRYLSQLLKKYKKIDLALAAYNAGPNRVDKYGAVPPYRETKSYVKKIKNRIKTKELR